MPINLDLIPARIYRKDLQGRFTYGNAACWRDMGLTSQAELIGKTDFDFFRREQAEQWRIKEEQLIANGGVMAITEEEPWLSRPSSWAQTSKSIEYDGQGRPVAILGISYDITEQYLESQRFKLAVQGHRDGVWQYDARSQVLWLSPQCLKILGLPDETAIVQRPIHWWRNRVEKADRGRVAAIFRATRPEQPTSEVDCRILCGVQSSIPVRIRLTAEFDDADRPILVSGSISDRSEFAVQEAYYRSLLDLVPSFIFVKNREFKFEFVNRAIVEAFDYPEHEILDHTDEELHRNRDQVAQFREDDQRVLTTGLPLPIKEETFDHKRLKRRVVLATIKVPRPPELGRKEMASGVVGVSTDITEFVETRQYLEALMNSVPDGVFFKDREHRFGRVNAAMSEYLGAVSPESCRRKSDFDFFPAPFADKWKFEEEQLFNGKLDLIPGDVRLTHTTRDGRTQWRKVSKIPVRDRDGTIIGLVGITHDLTQERETQAALRRQSQLLTEVLDSIPFQVALQDARGQYRLCNRAFARHFGLDDATQIVGKTDIELPHDPDAQARLQTALGIALGGQTVRNLDHSERDASGRHHKFTVTMIPLKDIDGSTSAPEDVLTIRDSVSHTVQSQELRHHVEFELLEWIRREEDPVRRIFILLLGLTHATSLRLNRAICWKYRPRTESLEFVHAIGQASEIAAKEFNVREKRSGHEKDIEEYSLQRCLDDFDKFRRQQRATADSELQEIIKAQRILVKETNGVFAQLKSAMNQNAVSNTLIRSEEDAGSIWSLLQDLKASEAILSIVPIQEDEVLIIACDNVRLRTPLEQPFDPSNTGVNTLQVVEAFLRNAREAIRAAVRQTEARHRASIEEAWRRLAHNMSHRLENYFPFTLRAMKRLSKRLQNRIHVESIDKNISAITGDLERALELVRDLKRYATPLELIALRRKSIRIREFFLKLEEKLSKIVQVEMSYPQEISDRQVEIDLDRVLNDCFVQLARNSARHACVANLKCKLNATFPTPMERFQMMTLRAGDWILFNYLDNGKGIPKEDKQQIFDPLFSTHPEGTGLGLPLAQRTIRAHDGQMDETGIPDHGVHFRILLPLTDVSKGV